MEKINFKDLNNKIEMNPNLLIIFGAEWCGQCKMAKLLIDKIQKNYPDLIFIEIDVDDNNLWKNEQLNIRSVPTFVAYKNKEQIFNVQGYQTEEAMKSLLSQFK